VVQPVGEKIHLADAGLIELGAEGHHGLICAQVAHAQGGRGQAQSTHGLSLGLGLGDHGFSGLEPRLLGPGGADGVLDAQGRLGLQGQGG